MVTYYVKLVLKSAFWLWLSFLSVCGVFTTVPDAYERAKDWGYDAYIWWAVGLCEFALKEHWPFVLLALAAVLFCHHLMIGQPQQRLKAEFDQKRRSAKVRGRKVRK